MNVSRYMESGATQRNGFTAISWEIWFVVASSSVEAEAESASQKSAVHSVGRVADAISGCAIGAVGRSRQAVQPQSTANPAYRADHIRTCVRRRRKGSRAKG